MHEQIDRELKRGELVEVSITDDRWVLAEVISDMETRVSVRLCDPIVWVENDTVVEKCWFSFLKPRVTKTSSSKYVETMTVSCLLVRLPNNA